MNPSGLKYSREHEWLRMEGDKEAVVGITHYAQEQLGDVVYVVLPNTGTKVTKDNKLSEVESVKAVSDIFAPASGEVIAVNADLRDSPELLNEDPYGKGWLVRLRLSAASEVDALMSVAQYEDMLSKES